MGVERPEDQLELFDVTSQASISSRPFSIGRITISFRYDHLVVAGIAALISSAVVFAFGVERGKHLARSERIAPLVPQRVIAQDVPSPVRPAAPVVQEAKQRDTKPRGSAQSPAVSPAEGVKSKPQKERAPSRTRYAIQVMTYRRLQLARQERQRLESKGERAFLVTNDGGTRVYVGPFPDKANASEKLTTLRGQYRDCFVRSL